MSTQLGLRVLGDRDQGIVDAFTFYGGEARTLRLQVFDPINDESSPIPVGAVKSLLLSGAPSDVLFIDGIITVDAADASIFTVNLTAANTLAMSSGPAKFTYTVVGAPTVIRIAYGEFVLSRLITIME